MLYFFFFLNLVAQTMDNKIIIIHPTVRSYFLVFPIAIAPDFSSSSISFDSMILYCVFISENDLISRIIKTS